MANVVMMFVILFVNYKFHYDQHFNFHYDQHY
nr:MAG TPA: hypothetical protein [Bacteriophage sp.]